MSRDISWINEIKNNTKQDYIMWVHDTDNEGEYKDAHGHLIGLNDGGQQVIIKSGAHAYVTGCGIPDGGDKDGKPKMRVICATNVAKSKHGDPGAGLRINRVIADDGQKLDKIVYRNHDTAKEIADVTFPMGMEQNYILRIENDGIFFDLKEAKYSDEWKAYIVGQKIGDFFEKIAPELAKTLLLAAQKALTAV